VKGSETVRLCKSEEAVGLTKPAWLALDMKQQLPREQTPDDTRSVVFDSAPLVTDMELLGNPRARVGPDHRTRLDVNPYEKYISQLPSETGDRVELLLHAIRRSVVRRPGEGVNEIDSRSRYKLSPKPAFEPPIATSS
jgi:hypothetical protein